MAAIQTFRTPINMSGLEIQNFRLQFLDGQPAGVQEGWAWYSTTNKSPMFFDGVTAVPMDARLATDIPLSALATDPLARANHTGTQTAATISDFAAQAAAAARSVPLNELAAASGDLDLGGRAIKGVADPVLEDDVVNQRTLNNELLSLSDRYVAHTNGEISRVLSYSDAVIADFDANSDATSLVPLGWIQSYVDAAVAAGSAAESAQKLATPRYFSLSGVMTSNAVAFDGTAPVVLVTEIADAALSIAKTAGLQDALNERLSKSGGEMTGPLTLRDSSPEDVRHAASKGYVDNEVSGMYAALDDLILSGSEKLATSRNFSVTGVVTADPQPFDGTEDVVFTTAIADDALTIAKTAGLRTELDSLSAAISTKQDGLDYTPVNVNGDVMTGPLMLAVTADPDEGEAVSRAYVDNAVQAAAAGLDGKGEVRVAADSNVALSGLPTIDGVAVEEGDSVLLFAQTDPAENGIWVVYADGWERRADADQDALTTGALTLVMEGTVRSGRQYWLNTKGLIDVGVTPQTWVPFQVGQAYTASNGAQLVGTDIQVNAGEGLKIVGGAVEVDTDKIARRAVANIGNGTDLVFTIPHNLGTRDICVTVRNTITNQVEYLAWTATDVNTLTLEMVGTPPPAAGYRVIIFA